MRKHSPAEAIKMMKETAKLFGAKDEDLVESEMSEAYGFWKTFPVCLKTNLNQNYLFLSIVDFSTMSIGVEKTM